MKKLGKIENFIINIFVVGAYIGVIGGFILCIALIVTAIQSWT